MECKHFLRKLGLVGLMALSISYLARPIRPVSATQEDIPAIYAYELEDYRLRLVNEALEFVNDLEFREITDFNDFGYAVATSYDQDPSRNYLVDLEGQIFFESSQIITKASPDNHQQVSWDHSLSKQGYIPFVPDGASNGQGLVDKEGNIVVSLDDFFMYNFAGNAHGIFAHPSRGIIHEEGQVLADNLNWPKIITEDYYAAYGHPDRLRPQFFTYDNRLVMELLEDFAFYAINDDYFMLSNNETTLIIPTLELDKYQGETVSAYDLDALLRLDSVDFQRYGHGYNDYHDIYVYTFNGYIQFLDQETSRPVAFFQVETGEVVYLEDTMEYAGYPLSNGLIPYVSGSNIGLWDGVNPEPVKASTIPRQPGDTVVILSLNYKDTIFYGAIASQQSDYQLYILDSQLQEVPELKTQLESSEGVNVTYIDPDLLVIKNADKYILFGPNYELITDQADFYYVNGPRLLYQEGQTAYILDKASGDLITEGVPSGY